MAANLSPGVAQRPSRRGGWRRASLGDHPGTMRLRRFLGMWATLLVVIGLTVVVDDRLDLGGEGDDQVVSAPDGTTGPGAGDTTTSAGDPEVVPGPGQVRVRGIVTAVHIEGAVLDPRDVPVPVTVLSDRGFGNGGELTGVEVDGEASSIVWDGGRPLVLSSGEALVLDPVVLDLTPDGLRLTLGGGVHGLTPGTYRLDTPVAVGTAGIATPRDSVTFTAGPEARFEARGDAALVLGPTGPRRVTGPGSVRLEGTLEVTDAAGARAATSHAVDLAAFDLILTPAPGGGWSIDGLIDSTGAG